MELDRFNQMVVRLERESAESPRLYRAKVAGLALLGFAILGLLLGAVGLGLLLLLGIVAVVVLTGGKALLLLAKFGKLLILLAVPLWYLCKSAVQALFVRMPKPQGHEVHRAEAPELFAALDDMRQRMKGPRFHHVLIVEDVNAAVVQRPAFGLIGWPRNYLLLGLPLLEAMPAQEALAVVAHEYGHLAGSHGRFSAYIYRLRHTWGTIQAYTEHIQGWLGKLVAPLVRWYAPYFNAYTFVLARADEYRADAASAQLVGPAHAASALKRVNLIAPQHHRFMEQTFERVTHEASPPQDLFHRWAGNAGQPPAEPDGKRWLSDALDRVADVMDTHPTLRARLDALPAHDRAGDEMPSPTNGPSAAQRWLGSHLEAVRRAVETRWTEQVAPSWTEAHAQAQRKRARLAALRAQPQCDPDETLEVFRLMQSVEPQADLREALAEFNAQHAQHPLGLFLEGSVRLDHADRAGLELLERSMRLDPEATKPACAAAHAFLREHGPADAAEAYAARWRQRDELETLRALQLSHVTAKDELAPHGLDADTLNMLRGLLDPAALKHVSRLYIARRVIAADRSVEQLLVGVELSWWGRQRSKQNEVVNRLVEIGWPMRVVVISLDGQYAALKKPLARLAGARIV